jgi:hypothetical protein
VVGNRVLGVDADGTNNSAFVDDAGLSIDGAGSHLALLGNLVHLKIYSAGLVVFGKVDDAVVGWNEVQVVATANSGEGVIVGACCGGGQSNIVVHDNLILDSSFVPLAFGATVLSVNAYNNVVANSGYYVSFDNQHQGNFGFFNNTLFHLSEYAIYGNSSALGTATLSNNIVFLDPSTTQDYVVVDVAYDPFTLDHNSWFNSTHPAPTDDAHALTVDPRFVNVVTGDVHLKSDSLARDAGVVTPYCADYDGTLRVGAPDLGAFEFH